MTQQTARITPRQKAFLAAYRASGYQERGKVYTSVYGPSRQPEKSAYKLLERPAVKAELDRMQAEDRERSKWSHDRIVAEWESSLAFANQNNDTPSVQKALIEIGKLHGHYVERTEDLTKPNAVDAETITKMVALITPLIAQALQSNKDPNTTVLAALGLASANQQATTH